MWKKISFAVFPNKWGLALRRLWLMNLSLFSLFLEFFLFLFMNNYRENVILTQFIPNLYLMSLHRFYKGWQSKPPTQWREACPPDQFPPINLTRFPLLSTIAISLVDRGNWISSTLKRGIYLVNFFCNYSYCFIKSGSLYRLLEVPIY